MPIVEYSSGGETRYKFVQGKTESERQRDREANIKSVARQTGYTGSIGQTARMIEAREAGVELAVHPGLQSREYKAMLARTPVQTATRRTVQRQGVQMEIPEVAEHAPIESIVYEQAIAAQERKTELFQRSALSDLQQAGLVNVQGGTVNLTPKGKNLGIEKIYALEEGAVWGGAFDFVLEGDELLMYPHGTREAMKAAGTTKPFFVEAEGKTYAVVQREGGEKIKVKPLDQATFSLGEVQEKSIKDIVGVDRYDSSKVTYSVSDEGIKVSGLTSATNPYAAILEKPTVKGGQDEIIKKQIEGRDQALKVVERTLNPKKEGFAQFVYEKDVALEQSAVGGTLRDLRKVGDTGRKWWDDTFGTNVYSRHLKEFGAGGVETLSTLPETGVKLVFRSPLGAAAYAMEGRSKTPLQDVGKFYSEEGGKIGLSVVMGAGGAMSQAMSGDVEAVTIPAARIGGGVFTLSALTGGLQPSKTKVISPKNTPTKSQPGFISGKIEQYSRTPQVQIIKGKATQYKEALGHVSSPFKGKVTQYKEAAGIMSKPLRDSIEGKVIQYSESPIGKIIGASSEKSNTYIKTMMEQSRINKPITFSEKIAAAKTSIDKFITLKKMELGLTKIKPFTPTPEVVFTERGITQTTQFIAIPKQAGTIMGKPLYQKQLFVTVTKTRTPTVAAASAATLAAFVPPNTALTKKYTPKDIEAFRKQREIRQEAIRQEVDLELLITPRTIQPIKQAGLMKQFLKEGTKARVTPRQIQRFGEIPTFGTIQRTLTTPVTTPIEKVTEVTINPPRMRWKVKEPPIPKIPSIPLFPKPRKEEGRRKGRKGKKRKPKTGYMPSFAGLDLGKIETGKAKEYYSGMEVRGVRV